MEFIWRNKWIKK